MKKLKIFIAGSIALSEERKLLKSITNDLEITFRSRGISVRIDVRDATNFGYTFAKNGQQQNYNTFITKEADLVFFILVGEVGGITEDEFDIAYESYNKYGHPHICVLSYIDKGKDNDNINNIRKKIEQIKQYYINYANRYELNNIIEHVISDEIYRRRRWQRYVKLKYIFIIVLIICGGLLIYSLREKISNKQLSQTSTQIITVEGVEFSMIRVNAGSFNMGDSDKESTIHLVTLTRDFMIGETEVTQSLWKAVMGNNPSHFIGDTYPVDNVSWDDCNRFISKLNELTGLNFRLPTEAEWEYAAKGGHKVTNTYIYSGSNNIDEVGWYIDNSDKHSHPVKQKRPNDLGIYDMSGNVWEWCQDSYTPYSAVPQTAPLNISPGDKRVRRGGSWRDNPKCTISTFRSRYQADVCKEWHGLRLVLDINY